MLDASFPGWSTSGEALPAPIRSALTGGAADAGIASELLKRDFVSERLTWVSGEDQGFAEIGSEGDDVATLCGMSEEQLRSHEASMNSTMDGVLVDLIREGKRFFSETIDLIVIKSASMEPREFAELTRERYDLGREILIKTRDVLNLIGVDTNASVQTRGGSVLIFDFVPPTWDVLLRGEALIVGSGLVAATPGAPAPIPLAAFDDGIIGVLIGKFFTLFGLGALWDGVKAALDSLGEDSAWAQFWKAVGAGLWSEAWRLLKEVIKLLLSGGFREILKKFVGAEVMETFLGEVAAKFAPFFGWIILAATIMAALATQLYHLLHHENPTA